MPESIAPAVLCYAWEQAPVFLAQFDEHGRLTRANRYTEDLLKGTVEQTFDTIVVDFAGTMRLSRLATEPGPHLLDVACVNGAPVTHVCHVQRSGNGYLVLGAVDIEENARLQEQILGLNSELSNAMRELHKSHAELAVLNRLKNQFLGMAAHDLRKPAGIVETYVGFLLDEASDVLEAEHVRFLETIRDMGRGMSRLIDDFLDVSIIESGNLELQLDKSRMQDVLRDVQTLVLPVAQRAGTTLEVQEKEPIPPVVMDAPKIEQALANLVSNAIEYSPAGATVLIRAQADKDTVAVSVRDDGPGISEEQKRTLFNAFSRGKTVKAGSRRSVGLGLMISKKIIDAHGGTIQVESSIGEGSTFVVALPLSGPNRRIVAGASRTGQNGT